MDLRRKGDSCIQRKSPNAKNNKSSYTASVTSFCDLWSDTSPESLYRVQERYVPYVIFLNVSSPCDTSLYVISQHFYIPVRFLPEGWAPYQGLG